LETTVKFRCGYALLIQPDPVKTAEDQAASSSSMAESDSSLERTNREKRTEDSPRFLL